MFQIIPELKRSSRLLAVFGMLCLLISCSSNSGTSTARSGLPFRAFVSNPVYPNLTGGGSPVLEIIDASKDIVSGYNVSLSSLTFSTTSAGMMSVSPNHDRTLVMSPPDSKLAVVDNAKESLAGTFTLPGTSESFFIGADNVSAFVAIPSAPVTGQGPGVVEKLSTSSGTVTATVPIPAAHFMVPSPSGNQILVFSDNSDTVTLLTPSLIGAASQPSPLLPCTSVQVAACVIPATFDRPVWALFDPSGSTAYIINCGPECGGNAPSISVVNVAAISGGSTIVTATVPVPAASTGLLQGNMLYIAGTLQGTGGVLSVLNLASANPATVDCTTQPAVNCQIFSITDGYHTRMQMGSNGQLFVGARGCSSGCLSILNTSTSMVVLPTDVGDVTGIASNPNRNVVYVCEGGRLRVYDTTTDQLESIPQPYGQPNIIGQAIDVAVVDF
jgi:hypothetical protein